MLAVAAGNIGGRLENGNFGLALATVSCALVLPPLFQLYRSPDRRTIVLLAGTLALAVVAGQGYMQIMLALLLPITLFLLPADRMQRMRVVRNGLLAVLLALLLASAFLVPLLHFLPQFAKDTDTGFAAATRFDMMPLYLVINDNNFFYTTAFDRLPYPYLYANFIGWVPILLACVGLALHARGIRGRVSILFFGALLVLFVGSGVPLRWLATNIPPLADSVAGLRYHPVMAGLAVPCILAIAAVGLDRLVRTGGPLVELHLVARAEDQQHRRLWQSLAFRPRVLLIIPLAFSLFQAREFAAHWVRTEPMLPHIWSVSDALRTPTLQWVNPPYGENTFTTPSIDSGLNLAIGFRPWHWRDRQEPIPLREADRNGTREGLTLLTMVDDISINSASAAEEYAILQGTGGARTICNAQGRGGDIDVRCDAADGGILVIKENGWTGWSATVNGRPADLAAGQWLAVRLDGGSQQISFRYRPWDAPIGLLFSLIGGCLALWLWFARDPRAQASDETVISAA